MRALPPALVDELNREFHSLGHFIELTIGVDTYRYADKDMDVVYNGYTYQSRGISFNSAQYSLLPKVDNLSFEIDNVQLEWSALIQNHEIRGNKCVILRVAFDRYLQVIAVAPLFIGFLDKVEIDQQKAQVEIYSHFLKWNTQTPRRLHTATCFWTFTDPETCRYSGAFTTCDKSWDNCTERANTLNFGGYKFLLDLQDREVQWGKTS